MRWAEDTRLAARPRSCSGWPWRLYRREGSLDTRGAAPLTCASAPGCLLGRPATQPPGAARMQHASPPPCTCAHGLARPVSRGRFLRSAAALLALGALAPVAEAADEVHWGYDGEVGPESWARLSPEFAVCGSGVRQSPVDIPPTAPLNPDDLAFDYKPSALNVVNNGHTVQVNYDPGSTLRLDGATYELAQYHFHTRSEHAFGGKLADMELHLVHRGPSGGLAVVGV